MATPANRVPVRIGRGTKANLDIALAAGDLKEGEILYATDEDKIYMVEGGTLAQAGGSSDVNGLLDVNAPSPSDQDVLKWDNAGGEWVNGTIDANNLGDVNAPAPLDGQALVWNNTAGEWQPGDSGASTLAALTDTAINFVANGDILVWNTGQAAWLNEDLEIGKNIDVDTTTTPPVNGQGLIWDTNEWVPGNLTAGPIGNLTDVDTTTVAPTNGQSLVWNGTDSEWQPGNAGGVSSIDDLSDVDTTTSAPTSGQVLAWDGSSNWVPSTAAAGGASTLSELDDTNVPAVQTVERFSGRWNEDPINNSPGPTDWSRWDGTGFFFVRVDGDADGQVISASVGDVVEGDTLEIARDSGYTDVLYSGEITAIFDSLYYSRYTLDPAVTGAQVDGEGALYVRVTTQSIDIEDNEVLVYDLTAQKWVPGQPTIPDKEINDLLNVATSPTVTLLNFDYPLGTAGDFEPFADEVAKASPELKWVCETFYGEVSNTEVKFGTGSLYLGSGGSIQFPSDHNSSTYPLWADDWALNDSDFTMELWWYHPTDGNTSDRTFFHWAESSGDSNTTIKMFYSHDGLEADSAFVVSYGEVGQSTTVVTFTLGTFIAYDTWHHVTLCRDGANLRAFLDGQQVGATHNIGAKVLKTPAYSSFYGQFHVAANSSGDFSAGGYIDAWNYVKEAKYTANFSIPTQAPEPLAPSDGDVLVYNSSVNKWEASPNEVSTLQSLSAPATATDPGNPGDIRYASGFVYICVATNTWQRAALTTW